MGVDWSEAREQVVNRLRKDFSQVDGMLCCQEWDLSVSGSGIQLWGSARRSERALYLGAEDLGLHPSWTTY